MQQVITRANVDPDLRRHMASLCPNELKNPESDIYFDIGTSAANLWYLWTTSMHEGQTN